MPPSRSSLLGVLALALLIDALGVALFFQTSDPMVLIFGFLASLVVAAAGIVVLVVRSATKA